jgi:sugar lactone lactonase YvrE
VTASQAGNTYYAAAPDVARTIQVALPGSASSAPTTAVGSTSAVQTATLTLAANTTLGATSSVAFRVLTRGVQTTNFAYAAGGTCAAGASYSLGQTCTVNYTFSPQAPGLVLGAIVLYDNSGTPVNVATSYLSGTGIGALAVFQNSSYSTFGAAAFPVDAAFDGAGNVYVTDSGAGSVLKFAPGGGTPATVVTGVSGPAGIAVDGAGNVYYGSNDGTIYELAGGQGTPFAVQSVPLPGSSIVVDAVGNLYVASTGGTIDKLAAGSHTLTAVAYSVPGGNPALTNIGGMALDGAGSLYVSDNANNIIYKLASGASTLTQVAVGGYPGSGYIAAPAGLAVDAAGDLYVGDNLLGVVKLTPGAGGYVQSQIETSFAANFVKVDVAGNLYVGDFGHGLVNIFQRNSPAVPAFADTVNGQQSAAQSVVMENDGNAALAAAAPGVAISSTNFVKVAGSGSPADCGTGFSLVPAASCNISIVFAPPAGVSGALSGTLQLFDNSPVAGSTQSASLSGTSLLLPQTITFTPPATLAYFANETLTLVATASSGLPVAFSVVSGPASVSGSTLTLTGPGAVVVAASQAGNGGYQVAAPVIASISVGLAVGTAGPTQTAVLTFTTAGTLNSINVLSQSGGGHDYAAAAGGTCTVGTAYSIGDTCTVNYTFTAQLPGYRKGGIRLQSSTLTVLANAYLAGEGIGPQLIFPMTSQVVSTARFGAHHPYGLGLGDSDVFVTDLQWNEVGAIDYGAFAGQVSWAVANPVPASGPDSSKTSGVSAPGFLTVDGSGNLFVASDTGVREFIARTPTNFGASNTAIGNFDFPLAVTVDGSGNLYVVDGDGSTYRMSAVNGTINANTPRTQIGNYNSNSLAVDPAGNVYTISYSGGELLELLAVGGSVPANPQTRSLGSYSFNSIAIDSVGNLYGTGDGSVRELRAVNGVLPDTPTVVTLPGTMNTPISVAADATGNIYFTDLFGFSIDKLVFAVAPSYSFASTGLGSSSAAQTMVLTNQGTAPLSFTGIAMSNADFAVSGGTCAIATPLAANATCTVIVSYAPTTALGAETGTLTLTDNTLNVAGSTQVIQLSGTAVQGTQTITFPPLGPIVYSVGRTVALSATASSGLAVAYTVVSGPATVSGSTLTVTGVGTVVVQADQAGNASYTAAVSVQISITVSATQTTPAITWTPATTFWNAGTAIGSAVVNAASTTAGAFAYTATLYPSGSAVGVNALTVLTAGNYTLTANFTPTDTVDYVSVSASRSISVRSANLVFVVGASGTVGALYQSGNAAGAGSGGGGIGAAVDSGGYVWSIDSSGGSLSKFTDTGTLSATYSGVGLSGASALAIDGNGQVWIANSNHSVSVLSNAGALISTTSDPSFSAPAGVAIDSSGNVWIANGTTSTVDEIVGGAAPAAPLANAVVSATPGVKP